MISVKDLSISYGNKRVLSNINIEIEDGEFVFLTGSNGGGKSTLLYAIIGVIPNIIDAKISGSVVVDKLDVSKHTVPELSKTIGLLLQDPDAQLFTSDIESEIAFPLENSSKSRDEIKERIEELLPMTELPRNKETWQLSEGQKQKVAIASVLALNPKILLLDEPTAELDQKGKKEIYKILGDLNKEGKTIIVVGHKGDHAVNFAKRVVVLNKKVMYDGSVKIFDNEKKCLQLGIEPLASKGQIKKVVEVKQIKKIKSQNPIITIENISAKYDNSQVFQNLSLSIQNGEFLVITGPTGSGKTTLVKHLNGLVKPESGAITLFNKNINDFTRKELSMNTCLLFQNPEYQIFERSVEREITVTTRRYGLHDQKKFNEIVKDFRIQNLLRLNPHTLSHGQKQLVALVSSLVIDPKLIILDEPTAYLDYPTKHNLLKKLSELKTLGKTIVVVTHDLSSFAALSDRILTLSNGELN